MNDPIGLIARIYEYFELPFSEQARVRMEAYLRDNPRGKHGRIVYDLKADFGLDRDELRRRFDFYFDRFAVKAEDGS